MTDGRHIAEVRRALTGVDPSYGDPTLFRMHRNLFCFMANHEYKLRVDDAEAIGVADADNLYMAGRNISGDFIAHASYRVTGSSVALGEGVGKAVGRL